MSKETKTVSLPVILRAHTALIKDEIKERITKVYNKWIDSGADDTDELFRNILSEISN